MINIYETRDLIVVYHTKITHHDDKVIPLFCTDTVSTGEDDDSKSGSIIVGVYYGGSDDDERVSTTNIGKQRLCGGLCCNPKAPELLSFLLLIVVVVVVNFAISVASAQQQTPKDVDTDGTGSRQQHF